MRSNRSRRPVAGPLLPQGHMYTLRSARIEEAESIAAFMERVIWTSVDAAPDEKAAFVTNTRKNLALWMAAPEGSLHLTAHVEDGALAGVVMAREFWNVCHLFIAPEHQGKGLGRRMLEAAITECSGRSPRGCLRLNSSRNASDFYRRMGFSVVPDAPMHVRGMQFERAV